jgi:hypothetical protein
MARPVVDLVHTGREGPHEWDERSRHTHSYGKLNSSTKLHVDEERDCPTRDREP